MLVIMPKVAPAAVIDPMVPQREPGLAQKKSTNRIVSYLSKSQIIIIMAIDSNPNVTLEV